jgi:hypothetical protein
VLLLDEPLAALDALTRIQVCSELADELAELALPALLVTHSFEDATILADRVGVIDHGRVVQLDRPDELLRAPATSTVAALTGANVLPGTAVPADGGSVVTLDGGGRLLRDPRLGPGRRRGLPLGARARRPRRSRDPRRRPRHPPRSRHASRPRAPRHRNDFPRATAAASSRARR